MDEEGRERGSREEKEKVRLNEGGWTQIELEGIRSTNREVRIGASREEDGRKRRRRRS
jgi:hypothetical protein